MAVGRHTPDLEAPREPDPGFRFVLSQPAFRLIWFAQLAAQLADKFLMFSLIILAYHVAGSSTPVAITLLAYTVPAVVIAPLAGVFADRHDRKLLMIGTNAGRALLIAFERRDAAGRLLGVTWAAMPEGEPAPEGMLRAAVLRRDGVGLAGEGAP